MAANLQGQVLSRPVGGYAISSVCADPLNLDSSALPQPVVSEIGDAQAHAVRIGGGYGRGIFLLLLYLASGGMGTGQTPIEFLSAAGVEIDPSLLTFLPGGTAATATSGSALDNNPNAFLGPN